MVTSCPRCQQVTFLSQLLSLHGNGCFDFGLLFRNNHIGRWPWLLRGHQQQCSVVVADHNRPLGNQNFRLIFSFYSIERGEHCENVIPNYTIVVNAMKLVLHNSAVGFGVKQVQSPEDMFRDCAWRIIPNPSIVLRRALQSCCKFCHGLCNLSAELAAFGK